MRLPRLGAGGALTIVTFVLSFVFCYGPEDTRMALAGALAVSAASAASVWLSGRRPLAGLLSVTGLTLGLPLIETTFEAMDLVVVLVALRAAMSIEISPWVVACACLTALTVNDAWQRIAVDAGFMEASVLYPLVLTALAVGAGVQSRKLELQRDELLALRAVDRQRAVLDERRRIARDLHDVAAHHLSALVVRNRLAGRVDRYDALRDAAQFTAETAADTLRSLRQVVHVLNVENEAPLAPQPRLADLDSVIGRMQTAGLEVEHLPFKVSRAGREVEVALVRIAQEALANVLKHRGPGRCWLDLGRRDGEIVLTVEDDGPPAWCAEVGERAWDRPGSYGLIGMRERAEACGGRLTVGPSARGGWIVSAVLPAQAVSA